MLKLLEKAEKLLCRNKISFYEYREIEDVCNKISDTTISSNVATFFMKNKIKVVEKGIGYKIFIK